MTLRTGINLGTHQKAELSTQITTPAAPGAKGCVSVCLFVRGCAFRYTCVCVVVCDCRGFCVENKKVNTR